MCAPQVFGQPEILRRRSLRASSFLAWAGARQDSAPADVTVPWHAQNQRFDSNPLALQPAPKVIKQATCQSRSGLKPPS